MTNESIGLIILITSWLTINIAPFTLGQMNIINLLSSFWDEGVWRYATVEETPSDISVRNQHDE
jgi:hypothetical protein